MNLKRGAAGSSPTIKEGEDIGTRICVDIHPPSASGVAPRPHHWIHMVDAKSRFNYIVTSKTASCSDVCAALEEFMTIMKSKGITATVVIRSDCFAAMGSEWQDWLRKWGIEHEPSAPHTQHQNGLVERQFGSVKDSYEAIMVICRALWPKTKMSEAAMAILMQAAVEQVNGKFVEQHGYKSAGEVMFGGQYAKARSVQILAPALVRTSARASASIGIVIGYPRANANQVSILDLTASRTAIRTVDEGSIKPMKSYLQFDALIERRVMEEDIRRSEELEEQFSQQQQSGVWMALGTSNEEYCNETAGQRRD
jgi:transposase InsO family protein